MVARRRFDPKLLGALIAAHVVVATLTWRDIGHRQPDEIRGPKWVWRLASAVQMGNALVYWLFARRAANPQDDR
jgi:hypothetical protein